MQTNALNRYHFTANLFTENEDGVYQAAGTIEANIVGENVAGVLNIFTREPLPTPCRVNALRDRAGQLIFPAEVDDDNGATFQINVSQPVVGPFGYREFYVNRAKVL